MNLRRVFFFAAALIATPLLPNAGAANVPPAFYGIILQQNSSFLQFTDGFTINASLGGSHGQLVRTPSPSVLSTLTGELIGTGSSNVEVQYFFRVDAPPGADPTVPIPIQVDAFLSYAWAAPLSSPYVDVPFSWSALASIYATSYTDAGQFDFDGTDIGCAGGGTLVCDGPANPLPQFQEFVTLHLNVLPGFNNVVQLNAGTTFYHPVPATTVGNPALFSSFYAYVDPVISIDPSFDATGYGLTLSDGVGNAANTVAPEPAGISFVAIGVVLLCRVRRRR